MAHKLCGVEYQLNNLAQKWLTAEAWLHEMCFMHELTQLWLFINWRSSFCVALSYGNCSFTILQFANCVLTIAYPAFCLSHQTFNWMVCGTWYYYWQTLVVRCHSQWNISQKPLVSIQLGLVLLRPVQPETCFPHFCLSSTWSLMIALLWCPL